MLTDHLPTQLGFKKILPLDCVANVFLFQWSNLFKLILDGRKTRGEQQGSGSLSWRRLILVTQDKQYIHCHCIHSVLYTATNIFTLHFLLVGSISLPCRNVLSSAIKSFCLNTFPFVNHQLCPETKTEFCSPTSPCISTSSNSNPSIDYSSTAYCNLY